MELLSIKLFMLAFCAFVVIRLMDYLLAPELANGYKKWQLIQGLFVLIFIVSLFLSLVFMFISSIFVVISLF